MTATSGTKILVDSDALIGLINVQDALHNKSVKISDFLSQNSFDPIVPYTIVLEAATALAKDKAIRRPDLAAKLLQDFSKTTQPNINLEVKNLVSKLYNSKTSTKNTPFDHYLLALAKKNRIKYIFSFDKFYKKQGLTLAKELL